MTNVLLYTSSIDPPRIDGAPQPMPFDATNSPPFAVNRTPTAALDPITWLAPAQLIARQASPRPRRCAARLSPQPHNLKSLFRREHFREHTLRPVLGVAIAVPLGLAATFLLSAACGWLG
jgi:hypothetical protein